jgi:hypothetical protein
MEACVDLRDPRASPLAIHRRWFITSGVVACRRVVPLRDSSVARGRPVARQLSGASALSPSALLDLQSQ